MGTLSLKNSLKSKIKAKKNKHLSEEKILEIKKVINILQIDYPHAFTHNPMNKPALKIGIHNDLNDFLEVNNLSKRTIKLALDFWCDGVRYWKSFKYNQFRVDLEGNNTSKIEPKHIEDAKRNLLKAKLKRKDSFKKIKINNKIKKTTIIA